MSVIIQKLSKNDLNIWEKFIIASPQATLFHTLEWNQMINETDNESYSEYLVYDREGVILGGIPLIFSSGKVSTPMMGYNGPIFSASLNYDQYYKTSKGYEVCSELIKNIGDLSRQVTIKNHPEIWNMRAFTFLNWNIETVYTHVFHCNEHRTTAQKFKESFVNKMRESECSITTNITNELVSKYCSIGISDMNISLAARKREKEILERRIQWLLIAGLGKMVLLTNKNGDELGVVFLLFSKPSSTIYLWKVVQLVKGNKSEIIPLLVWQIDQAFGGEFNRLDLGESETMEISNLKDEMGGVLTPLFIARNLNG